MGNFNLAKYEEEILRFWEQRCIFKKSLDKNRGKRAFVFYEGPPTANARPGLHHVLARIFKDIIPRFKTMQGFYVERKAGWDTHGLPVEIEIEKKLGFKHKSDILSYGIEKFNTLCRESVWSYIKDWNYLTKRIGYWLDLDNPYITYDVEYMETLWWIIKEFYKRKLLYSDFKVLPYCPRCETSLSSHELAQGYKKIEDESIYFKLKIKREDSHKLKLPENTYFLVWTTTPWTLPANVALAVNPELTYVRVKIDSSSLILERTRSKALFPDKPILETYKGKDLEGLSYEQIYAYGFRHKFLYKVYTAPFVSHEDGTGIVHIAPAYGEDDFNLRQIYHLPLIHTVDASGNITNPTVMLSNSTKELKLNYHLPGYGLFVKEADRHIKEDLVARNMLVGEEKIVHKYPFCWRCRSPVIYYAKRAWYVAVSRLRKKLISNNQKINWVPQHIKNGRFGKFLEEAKDWNFSRERFWGTPLPIWTCNRCGKQLVIGSRSELLQHQSPIAKLIIIRHGESENSVKRIASADPAVDKFHLTDRGRDEVVKSARQIKRQLKSKKIDLIISSDLIRTRETADILSQVFGVKVLYDKRLRDIYDGIFNLKPYGEFYEKIGPREARFELKAEGGESFIDLRRRLSEFLEAIKEKYYGKTILVVSHKDPIWIMQMLLLGLTKKEAIEKVKELEFQTADWRQFELKAWPVNKDNEIDLHRPYIDAIKLNCSKCGSKVSREKYLVDVWFDSGSMPLAQAHFPFAQAKINNKMLTIKNLRKFIAYPADYITEAVDQTRGWFYTLLAVSTCLGLGSSYRNVICLGLILDEKGQKMSKSRGNIVDPNMIISEFGADAVRWYFYTVNEPGNSKLFNKSDIANCLRNFILIYLNIINLIEFYTTKKITLKGFLVENLKEPINK
ncbi:MAG: class I tRNA ligase family protein, partial [Candidatus Bathyarchaeia archaeon]